MKAVQVTKSLCLLAAAMSFATASHAQNLDAQRRAVEAVVANAPDCQKLGPFYWEIGNGSGALASGRSGFGVFAHSELDLASASKWVFGAYVVQRMNGALTRYQASALTMQSGFDSLKSFSCGSARTVDDCLYTDDNATFTRDHVGHFSYDGGHAQMLAHVLGMGNYTAADLTADLHRTLGYDITIAYKRPQPAGGMVGTPANYGRFLRKIINGELRIAGLLGAYGVCTLPGESCPSALESPSPYNWQYSLHHWVENAPGHDGAFSSAGAFGFYPWISADRSTYGVLARQVLEQNAGANSAQCGGLMRRAWFEAANS